MPRSPRPPSPRPEPAAPADRPPAGSSARVGALALLVALALAACDDGPSGVVDRGPRDVGADATAPDAERPDAAPDAADDARAADAERPDAAPDAAPDATPDAAPPQAVRPAVVAGGSTVESGRYRLRLSLGGPSPTHVTSSDRLKARIGVALPLPDTEERPR